MTIFTDGSKTDPGLQGEDGKASYGRLATIGDADLEEKGYLGATTVLKAELFTILTSLLCRC